MVGAKEKVDMKIMDERLTIGRTRLSSRLEISYLLRKDFCVLNVLQENASALSPAALSAIERWIVFLITSNQPNQFFKRFLHILTGSSRSFNV
jgi:hypothetical protein